MVGAQSIGDDAESVESSSATITESEQGFMPVYFEPRPLKNLQLVDELECLAPILDMKVASASPLPQITWTIIVTIITSAMADVLDTPTR